MFLKAIFIIRKNSPYSGAEDTVLWLATFRLAKFLIEVISLFTELRPYSEWECMQGERGIYLT